MYPIVISHPRSGTWHGLDFLGNLDGHIVVICVMHDYVISVRVHLTTRLTVLHQPKTACCELFWGAAAAHPPTAAR